MLDMDSIDKKITKIVSKLFDGDVLDIKEMLPFSVTIQGESGLEYTKIVFVEIDTEKIYVVSDHAGGYPIVFSTEKWSETG